ncbi:hypothetical protein [Corynebacterium sp. c7Ub_26]
MVNLINNSHFNHRTNKGHRMAQLVITAIATYRI